MADDENDHISNETETANENDQEPDYANGQFLPPNWHWDHYQNAVYEYAAQTARGWADVSRDNDQQRAWWKSQSDQWKDRQIKEGLYPTLSEQEDKGGRFVDHLAVMEDHAFVLHSEGRLNCGKKHLPDPSQSSHVEWRDRKDVTYLSDAENNPDNGRSR